MHDLMPVVRVLIGLIAAVGIAGLITNTILTGRDIPAGLLGLLTFIVGAVFGIGTVWRGWNGNGRKGPYDD